MIGNLWHYRCKIVRVVDGDTIQVVIDGGFHNYQQERLRLLGVDAPEVVGANKAAGLAARQFVMDWLAAHSVVTATDWPFIVRTVKTDSFGRYLADVFCAADGASLVEALREYLS